MRKKAILRVTTTALIIGATFIVTAFTVSAQGVNANNGVGQSHSQQQNQHNQNQQSTNSSDMSYDDAEQYMIDQGIFKGNGKGNYNFSNYLKRGDLMVMVNRAFKFSSNSNSNGFCDVSSDSYYYDDITTARNLGIVKGDGKNFYPQYNVTIGQAILVIERAAEKAGITIGIDLESLYDSDDLTDYATRDDVAEMLYYVLTGDTDGLDDYNGSLSLAYAVDENEAVTFDAEDFATAYEDATGEDLAYVTFALPASKYGTLYYDYTSSDSYDSVVSNSLKYYVDDEPSLDGVTFVPADDYSGPVSVYFTGYADDGTKCIGVIKITVVSTDVTADTITYTTDEEEAVTFDVDDLIDACDEATGEELSYVKFTLTSSSYGKLYYDYTSSDNYDSKVSASTKYYADDDPYIDDVTFVPADDYTDTVSITYTGYTEDGTTYTGTIKITID